MRFSAGRMMLGASLPALVLMLPSAAFAQEPQPPVPSVPAASTQASQPEAEAGEIIVTARRRGENLAKVPAVVAAFSGEQLTQRGIIQQSDLQVAVPGLVVRQTQSNNNLNYVIRGQSVDAFSGSATAIVPYVNEVQFAPGGASSFFDLESVQVLKGPQGTLFGRNATGGAVLLTTAKPVNALTGSIKVAVGNYDYRNVSAMLNVPIVDDKVLLRGAFDGTWRGGYVRNTFTGQNTGRLDRQVGRLSLTLNPVEGLSNTTVGQYERAGGNNTASVLYSVYQCGRVDPTGRPLTCSAAALFGPQLDAAIGVPGAWNTYLAAHPGANPGGINAALAARQAGGFWQTQDYSRTAHRGRNAYMTNRTSAELGDDLVLKNIFGLSRTHNSDIAAQTGAPYLILSTFNALGGPPRLRTNSNDEIVKTISEELQLQGKLFDSRLDYVVGTYFARTRNRIFYPATYTDLSPVFPLIPDVSTSYSNYKQQDSQQAVYAQASYDLGSGVKLNGGYRHTWEQVTSDQLSRSRFFGADRIKVTFDKPSWLAGIDWQATRSLLLYAQTRGSWRAGGINGIARPIASGPASGGSLYAPETTKDVEIGAKFEGLVAGRRAHLYLAAYRQGVDNIQRAQILNVPVGGGVTQPLLFTINVPSARIQGAELDSAIDVTPWLRLAAVGAYTDAKYRNNQLTAFGQSYFFGPYGDAPKWSGTLSGQVMLPVGGRRDGVVLRADLYGQTGFYFSNTAGTRTPDTRLPGYALLNLRADWNDVLGTKGLTASLSLRNALKEKYYVGGFALGDLLGINSANVGEPRVVTGELRFAF